MIGIGTTRFIRLAVGSGGVGVLSWDGGMRRARMGRKRDLAPRLLLLVLFSCRLALEFPRGPNAGNWFPRIPALGSSLNRGGT